MATGREGLGRPRIPDFIRDIPRRFWAHTSDDIDFTALRGKRVIVIGGGASAMDNAGEALEAGCAELRMLIRRDDLPRINKLTGIGSAGFHPRLSRDAAMPGNGAPCTTPTTPARPRHATRRCASVGIAMRIFILARASKRCACATAMLTVRTTRGKSFAADFIILATGFTVETTARPEIADYADAIATWADRYTPPPELASAELGGFPYLGPHFQFTEKQPGERRSSPTSIASTMPPA